MLPLAFLFFFNDTATTEIYTLSLHDALPILSKTLRGLRGATTAPANTGQAILDATAELLRALQDANGFQPEEVESAIFTSRSEEHTSELQSQSNLVCRLLLEKKKKMNDKLHT